MLLQRPTASQTLPLLTRRQMLSRSMLGFGSVALADMLARQAWASTAPASDLSARSPHHRARAKRIIYIFLDGGLSQIDSWDYKPLLQRDDGKPLPASIAKPKFPFAPTGQILRSPFQWKQWGESGMWASDLFPHLHELVDELCFIHAMHHDNEDHFTAKNMIFTGSGREPRPALGSWLVYGLGTENRNLPGYIDIVPGLPKSTSPAFLPAMYASTPIGRTSEGDKQRRWDNLSTATPAQLRQLQLIQSQNRLGLQRMGADAAIEGEIASMELAFRMQSEAPQAMSLEGESDATKTLYGIGEPHTSDFGTALLMARRFAERGVRYITVSHATQKFGNLWDQHSRLYDGHKGNARAVDLPIAGFLRDLKARGMLEDTLVMCGSEFGRTPMFEYMDGATGRQRDGRDHNPHGFTLWLAGAGVKKAYHHGETDDYGFHAVKDPVSVHDLHATLLHLMGIDHTRLTFRHAGRDYRLTDVYGEVVRPILV